MPRYALKVEYNGAPFAGWQRQAEQPSVQGAIESALAKLEPGEHTIAAAGRTDAGVHAGGQFCHCELAKDWSPFRLSEALNHHLKPLPVAIVDAAEVAEDWHARFSALERRYLFRLVSRRAPLTLEAGQVWQVKNALALEPMQAAAQHLREFARREFAVAVHGRHRPLHEEDQPVIGKPEAIDGVEVGDGGVMGRGTRHDHPEDVGSVALLGGAGSEWR